MERIVVDLSKDKDFKRGNVVVLVRPLADLICIVQEGGIGETIKVRYMDGGEGEAITVKKAMVIKLADEQELALPPAFMEAIERQREVIFTQKKRTEAQKIKSLERALRDNPEILKELTKMLMEETEESEGPPQGGSVL